MTYPLMGTVYLERNEEEINSIAMYTSADRDNRDLIRADELTALLEPALGKETSKIIVAKVMNSEGLQVLHTAIDMRPVGIEEEVTTAPEEDTLPITPFIARSIRAVARRCDVSDEDFPTWMAMAIGIGLGQSVRSYDIAQAEKANEEAERKNGHAR